MTYALVNKIIPFSSVDGKGNRTAIFLQGCNFNCHYCHNPETINVCNNCGTCVSACPTGALETVEDCAATNDKALRKRVIYHKDKCVNCDNCIKNCKRNSSPKIMKMTVEDVMSEVIKYMPFIEGITVSGGECTLQEDFLIELFKEAKNKGLTCFIDSNGSKSFRDMSELMSVTDKVMLDVKSYDNEIHKSVIGMDNKNVIDNLKYLLENHKLYEVRTVVVPELLNNEDTIYNVSKIIGQFSNSNKSTNNDNVTEDDVRYKLIKYRSLGVRNVMENYNTPEEQYMKYLETVCIKNCCNNILVV